MIKSFSIVLTHFSHFNELKILRQPGYLLFQGLIGHRSRSKTRLNLWSTHIYFYFF